GGDGTPLRCLELATGSPVVRVNGTTLAVTMRLNASSRKPDPEPESQRNVDHPGGHYEWRHLRVWTRYAGRRRGGSDMEVSGSHHPRGHRSHQGDWRQRDGGSDQIHGRSCAPCRAPICDWNRLPRAGPHGPSTFMVRALINSRLYANRLERP